MNDDSKYEMPVGLSLSLSVNPNALDYFSTLDIDTKLNIKNYLQSSSDGTEALKKNNEVIQCLNNYNTNFLK